ncbi:baseplate J/gp47 family protein [Neolewinella lacunae]|uniref:Baseplate J/gp47 family protein n=1 Tax=Neolewinella lacunae TaxID=1517758 RepID=A0A923PNE7_9BACT|nr:baseplate J/gp47 family protein [Neolewinella lacunae]MBC6996659.1 baseplate J/gp47 family protein [Neolewinella lacunae]MDN3634776.1 baseplate J/gp47 family protein [Neolewinella lacunae]
MTREKASPLANHHGTARHERQSGALEPTYVRADERTLPELLAYAYAYAKHVRFFAEDGLDADPATGQPYDWRAFFEGDESVFLATVLTTDLHEADEELQTAFLNIHQLKDHEQQANNFTQLIEKLLQVTQVLHGWQTKARKLRDWNEEHRFEREINRALQGDLGLQYHGFYYILKTLVRENTFPAPAQRTWQEVLDSLPRPRERGKDERFLHWVEPGEVTLADWLAFAGIRLQEYYRKLYFTLAYLLELSQELFEQSVHYRNDHSPQMGLFIAFLRLFGATQEELNTLTGRHLDYYYHDVLGREPNPGQPDQAIVSFQSTPGQRDIFLERGALLLAGTDPNGQAAYYRTEDDLDISATGVAALKTLFVSKNPIVATGSTYRLVTAVYAAPVADSADGRGEPFTGADATWPVLGEDQFDFGAQDRRMPASVLGFALAASVLLLGEGDRKVNIDLCFTAESFTNLVDLLDDIAENTGPGSSRSDVFRRVFGRPFHLLVTGEKGWTEITKYRLLPLEEGQTMLRLEFQLDPAAPAIRPLDPAVHGSDFNTAWPVLKITLSDQEASYAYSFLRDLELERIDLDVKVTGLKTVTVQNDQGLVDSSGPFLPFGPFPRPKAYFLFGHAELFNKQLTDMELQLDWAHLPDGAEGFSGHYRGYDEVVTNDSFTFSLSALTDYAFQPMREAEQDVYPMFESNFVEQPPLRTRRILTVDAVALKRLRYVPLYTLGALDPYTNGSRTGYFKLQLRSPAMAFGHARYPTLFARRMAEGARRPFSLFGGAEDAPLDLPNEPYTPVISALSINYRASTSLRLARLEQGSNDAAADNRLFRLHPFGTEKVFAGGLLESPYLLPRFDEDGYLYIGLRDLPAPRMLSLFFDLQDSKKKLSRQPTVVQWHYLARDGWQPFAANQILSDTTVDLSTRGIVRFDCPAEMSKGRGLLDHGLYWIRASASGSLSTMGRCRRIIPHAVVASWVDGGDATHLIIPPSERPPITELLAPPPGIGPVYQATGFTKGLPRETEAAFRVRASERLRHKGRAVSAWDIERLVLEKFPDIHQVKCISAHGNETLLQRGEVRVVVIPAIVDQDPRPMVGYHALRDIEQYLRSVAGAFAQIRVTNPTYEQLKVSCQVRLTPASQAYRGRVLRELHDRITAFVCPWLQQGVVKLGGTVSKTDILAVLNAHPAVQFVTGFALVQLFESAEDYYALRDTARPTADTELITASRPWSVLIPVPEHQIELLSADAYAFATVTALDEMRVEGDFIITSDDPEPFSFDAGSAAPPGERFALPLTWLQP